MDSLSSFKETHSPFWRKGFPKIRWVLHLFLIPSFSKHLEWKEGTLFHLIPQESSKHAINLWDMQLLELCRCVMARNCKRRGNENMDDQ